jgi:hypothetical protein
MSPGPPESGFQQAEDRTVKDAHENRPEDETQPRTEAEHRSLTRGLAQDLATQYGDGAAKAAGAATVYYAIKGAAKVKEVLTPKDEPSKIVLPPGRED